MRSAVSSMASSDDARSERRYSTTNPTVPNWTGTPSRAVAHRLRTCHLSCRFESLQFLLETYVEAVKVVEEWLLRGVAAVACAIEAEDDLPSFKSAKVILLNAAEMTKVLPEETKMTTGTEGEFGGFKGFQQISR